MSTTLPSGDSQAPSLGPPQAYQTRRISLFPPFSESRLCSTHTPPCTDPQTGYLLPHHYAARDITIGEAVKILQGEVHRAATEEVRRHEPEAAAYARAKRSLWSMSQTCTAVLRSNDATTEFSGLIPSTWREYLHGLTPRQDY